MADYEHPEALATTEWLAAHLDDPSVRVVDMRYQVGAASDGSFRGLSGRETYDQGHIPGAVFLDVIGELAEPEDEVPLNILRPGRFEALMGGLGIGNDCTVVVYDDRGGTWAARLWWALRYYGHDDAKVLDGGITKWVQEDRPLEKRAPAPSAAVFRAQVRPELKVTSDEVMTAIGSADACIVDALPERFYTGESRLFPTHRAGHIPTAVNVPATINLDPTTHALLPADELTTSWSKAGLQPDKKVIIYCGSGIYAAFNLFVLYVLGHERATLYDGSWMEWGADPVLPVEMGLVDRVLGSD